MVQRAMVAALFLLGVALGEDEWDLNDPPKVVQARVLRAKATKLWEEARPLWEQTKGKQPVSPDAVPKAVEALEDAVRDFERSIELEWDMETNNKLADAVRAWYALRPLLPKPPEPADEEAREKADKAAARERSSRLRDVRKFVMEYGKARKFENQFARCTRCDGRKVLRSPFGGSQPCPRCKRSGTLAIRKGVLEAHWHFRSPLQRADGRRQSNVSRLLRSSRIDPKRLAPFVRTLSIDGDIEDHDTWVRVKTKEKIYTEPGSKRSEKSEAEYVLYRVGRTWFLYEARYDRDVLRLPEEEKE